MGTEKKIKKERTLGIMNPRARAAKMKRGKRNQKK